MERRFDSKRDTWLTLIIFAAIVLMAGVFWPLSLVPFKWAMLLPGLVSLGSILLLLWVYFGTYYVVADGILRIYHGPFRWRIALSSINSIEAVRLPWSSPALSMDRLRINYESGKNVMISPRQQQEFLRTVKPG